MHPQASTVGVVHHHSDLFFFFCEGMLCVTEPTTCERNPIQKFLCPFVTQKFFIKEEKRENASVEEAFSISFFIVI